MGGGGEARGGVQSVQKQYLYTPTRATECTAPTGNGNGMLTVLLFLFLSGATDGLVQRGQRIRILLYRKIRGAGNNTFKNATTRREQAARSRRFGLYVLPSTSIPQLK